MRATTTGHPGVVFMAVAVLLLGSGCSSVADPRVIADAQTAARVKTALVNDPVIGVRAIEVRVATGVATLFGRVQDKAEAARAIDLARSVPGVGDVRSSLLIGIEPSSSDPPPPPPPSDNIVSELQPNPTLLAVGGSFGWSRPRAAALQTRVSVSPLIKLGSGQGLGPAIGFDWFQADVRSGGAGGSVLSRVHIRPVMAGLSYTLASERVSVASSLVGGLSFNSLTVTETGPAADVPVEVANSLAWRPGVSVWFDLSPRLALNVAAGHVMTNLRITVLEGGRLVNRTERGDTTIGHAGLAYKLF